MLAPRSIREPFGSWQSMTCAAANGYSTHDTFFIIDTWCPLIGVRRGALLDRGASRRHVAAESQFKEVSMLRTNWLGWALPSITLLLATGAHAVTDIRYERWVFA